MTKLFVPMRQRTYKKLKRGEEMYCTFEESPFDFPEEAKSNFRFINYKQFEQTKILPPGEDAIPFVGWYMYCGVKTHPDLKDRYMYPKPKNQNDLVFAQVEVPENQVVFSDALGWSAIRYGEYYPSSNTIEELEKELKTFNELSDFEQILWVAKSWERVFDVDPESDFVFGSFWKLTPKMLIE